MKDLKLKDNDLELIDGDLPLVNGLDRTIQHIDTGLEILINDWCLEPDEGINYVLGLKGYPEIMRSQIKHAIKTVYGVNSLTKFSMEFTEEQKYIVNATVRSGNEEFPLSKEVGVI